MSRRAILVVLAVAVFAVMLVTGIILALAVAGRGPGIGFGDRIALLEVSGPIFDDEQFLRDIRHFQRERSIRGYVVAINSPGGGVGASQSIYREMQRLREDGVPVIATMSGTGASGGYYIALGADSIFALPGTVTGSVGVIMQLPDLSELMERIGVHWDIVQSREHKDMGSPFRRLTPEDRVLLEAMVQDVHDQFVEVVAAERGLARERVLEVADGRLLSGRQALELGLVDRIGNLHDAISAAGVMTGLGPRPRIATPPRPRFRLLDLLLGGPASFSWLLDPATLAESLDRAREPRYQLQYVVPF